MYVLQQQKEKQMSVNSHFHHTTDKMCCKAGQTT